MDTPKRRSQDDNSWSKKLQVFISSPFVGMEELRRSVMEGVVRAGHVPIALENFSFSNATDMDVILDALQSCQVYILILGPRYGQMVEQEVVDAVKQRLPHLDIEQGISFTELEFRIARYLKKQGEIVVYVVSFESEVVAKLRKNKKLEGQYVDPPHRAHVDEMYWRFYKDVAKEHSFGKPFQPGLPGALKILALEIQDSLRRLDSHQLRGWVRELKGVSPTLYQRLSKSPLTQAIIEALGLFDSLDQRTARESSLKERAGQFFWDKYSKAILGQSMNLFFESGSTVAYAAHHIGPALEGARTLRTNNVLAQMLLWIKCRQMCEMFPSGVVDPDDKFGATFGECIDRLEAGTRGRVPDYRGTALDEDERNAIAEILANADSPQHWKGRTLLLGAISGIQMSDKCDVVYSDAVQRTEELHASIAGYRGFHVGSYKNKIFKRFMFATDLPIVILADESKINCQVLAGNCHFIFDRELSWDHFLRHHPVAFCIAYHRSAVGPYRSDLTRPFDTRGFRIVEDEGTTTCGAFIARNAAFEAAFPG